MADPTLSIPPHLLPADGRFGSGPSRVRDAQMQALSRAGHTLMGTSHRQAPVKKLVQRIQEGLAELFSLPDGYEVVLGNGGATALWDVATFSLVDSRAQHLVFGEFSGSFAKATAAAPFLRDPSVIQAPPGSLAAPEADDDVDVFAWPHNETSTGVMAPVQRVPGQMPDQLVLVDATSGAGGLDVDVSATDLYYFAPQKSFASDGGLWIALTSPAAIDRAQRIAASGRYIPGFLNFSTALENSRKHQTLNTPAIATLILMAEQVEWMNEQGGLSWAAGRSRETSGLLHDWVRSRADLEFFVADEAARSRVVTTIDVDESIDAALVASTLRAHGIVDVEPYRKLGRNQLRIATFPAVEAADVRALIASTNAVLDQLAAR
ncbi:MAG: phosphoserine transaminase [Dermabacter sp.]|nr:phosphoserine transaminase [Dermabacter sp.]